MLRNITIELERTNCLTDLVEYDSVSIHEPPKVPLQNRLLFKDIEMLEHLVHLLEIMEKAHDIAPLPSVP